MKVAKIKKKNNSAYIQSNLFIIKLSIKNMWSYRSSSIKVYETSSIIHKVIY
jgi:hypothetical protein